jgi:hypothetical protein
MQLLTRGLSLLHSGDGFYQVNVDNMIDIPNSGLRNKLTGTNTSLFVLVLHELLLLVFPDKKVYL